MICLVFGICDLKFINYLNETTPKWHGFLMIKLAAFQAGGGPRISVTIDDYSHETHEKTRKIIFILA